VHRANKVLKQLGYAFLSYLEQGARSLSVFFTTAADLLQVNIAFVLEIFSLSDKKKVLGVFDRHCWDAACCSRMSELRDYACSLLPSALKSISKKRHRFIWLLKKETFWHSLTSFE